MIACIELYAVLDFPWRTQIKQEVIERYNPSFRWMKKHVNFINAFYDYSFIILNWHPINDFSGHKKFVSKSALVRPLNVATPCDSYARNYKELPTLFTLNSVEGQGEAKFSHSGINKKVEFCSRLSCCFSL